MTLRQWYEWYEKEVEYAKLNYRMAVRRAYFQQRLVNITGFIKNTKKGSK